MTMFEPQLWVTVSADKKSFVVHAAVTVPDGSYISAGTSDDTPAGIMLIPEVQPLQLRIQKIPGAATGGIQVLHFARKFPFSTGKWSIAAFAMLDDLTDRCPGIILVGRASIGIPHAPEMESLNALTAAPVTASGAWVVPGGVRGWIDTMPGPSYWTLHLRVGMCANIAGYTYKLTPKGPFGITGRTLLCEMTATKPTGHVAQVRTHTVVPYDEKIEKGTVFDSMLVVFEGDAYMGPISIVS